MIKPPGFEFPALLEVVKKLPEYQHDYFFDALWRFLIQSELAYQVVAEIENKPTVPRSREQQVFLDFTEGLSFDVRQTFSNRLESALEWISGNLTQRRRIYLWGTKCD